MPLTPSTPSAPATRTSTLIRSRSRIAASPAALFQQSYGDAFAEIGLQNGDYGVLAALRRAGAPFQLTPTDLARHRMMTSGGMTAAIDRLERKGLVSRLPNPNDRRGNLVKLTDDGRRIVDAAMNVHADVEHRLVAGLDEHECEALQRLLRKLLTSVDSV